MKEEKRDIYWHGPSVKIEDRWKSNRHKSCLLWFTGLSASGKSTVAHALSKRLHNLGVNSYVLDGDNIRHGLNKDLSLSPEDRKENIRRIGEVAKLFIDAGLLVMAAFIAPYKEDRERIRNLLNDGEYIEVFIKCSLDECGKRDPKGLYKRAKEKKLKGLTGIDAPYEEPDKPELVLETDKMNVEKCVDFLLSYLINKDYISKAFIDSVQKSEI